MSDNYQNDEQDRKLNSIAESVKVINHELGSLDKTVAVMKSTLKRHEALLWIILGIIISGAIKTLLF